MPLPFLAQLVIALVVNVISYVLQPKPKAPRPAAFEDMDAPTAESRPIPVVFGTVEVKAPNFISVCERATETVDDGKFVGSKYYYTFHLGICLYGPGIRLVRVRYGEKTIWQGGRQTLSSMDIDRDNLFGGRKKEGGVGGIMWWLPGAPDQVLPISLTRRTDNKPQAEVPAHRGIASVAFHGRGNRGGFYWSANTPYLRSLWFRVERPSEGLSPAYALIPRNDGSGLDDSNPAHMIWEAHVAKWGSGVPESALDRASYEAAALTLYNEGFGLSMQWTRQSPVEEFIAEVQDHIRAVTYDDPTTGLRTIKLLRHDYDANSLPEISPDNALLTNFGRKVWGEVANEIVVSYTNPENEETATVTAQDLGSISVQGGVISTGRNYYGVRTAKLASFIADRDLAVEGMPLATCDVRVDRTMWSSLYPGAVVNLRWPERGIERMVMRVGRVNYGAPGDAYITASIYEDVFGVDAASYIDVSGAESPVDTAAEPANLTQVSLFTAPLYMALRLIGKDQASDLPSPKAVAAVLAQPQTTDDITYDLQTLTMQPTGLLAPASLGDKPFAGGGQLEVAMPAAAETPLTGLLNLTGAAPDVNSFLIIGDGSEANSEIALVTAVSDTAWTLRRGLLDTYPRSWPAGTQVWIVPWLGTGDDTIRANGDSVTYRLLPSTSLGELPWASATDRTIVLSQRAHRPLRPADVRVNGVGFGTVDAVGLSNLSVTWANRNRLLELVVPAAWTDADASPEVGQTTTIIVQGAAGEPLQTYANLTGSSYTVPVSAFGAQTSGYVQVRSVRDGLNSLQAYRVRVLVGPMTGEFSSAFNEDFAVP